MPQYNPLEGLNLPQSQYMPQEYNQQVMGQMQIGQQRAEQDQMRKFLEGINAMGRMYTGSALRGGIEQVLGPQMERQQQLLGNIGLQGMEAQRGERLTGEQRTYETEQAQVQRDWQAAQAELQRQFQAAQLEKQMAAQREKDRKGSRFSSQLTSALPQLALGALTGGAGMALGALPSLFGGGGNTTGSYTPTNNFVMDQLQGLPMQEYPTNNVMRNSRAYSGLY